MGERPGELRTGSGQPDDSASGNLPDDTVVEINTTVVEIEQTRSEMSDTIDAIQEKLSPRHLKDEAKGLAEDARDAIKEEAKTLIADAKEEAKTLIADAKETVRDATIGKVEHMASTATTVAKETSTSLLDTIKENPIPAAIAGISLGWLIMKSRGRSSNGSSRRFDDSYRYDDDYRSSDHESMASRAGHTASSAASKVGDKASSAASKVGDTASSAASKVGDTASSAAGKVTDTASTVADKASNLAGAALDKTGTAAVKAQRQIGQVPDRVGELMQSTPLIVAGAAVAIGAAAGLMLPETDQERQLLGSARDRFMDSARGVYDEAKEKIQHVAEEATTAAKEEAKNQNLTS